MRIIDIHDDGKWKTIQITDQFHAKLVGLKNFGCSQEGPNERFVCTREKNHTGAHIGHGDEFVCAAWPNDNSKATPPKQTRKSGMNPAQTFEVEDYKIHFQYDFMPEPDGRRFTTCIIETSRKNFYSGVAVLHPKENINQRIGWHIALQRACYAFHIPMNLCKAIYRSLWHEIRSQLREQEMKEKVSA